MKIFLTILSLLIISPVPVKDNFTIFSSENSDLPENDIWSISVDTKGNKWIGTAKSGLVRMNGDEMEVFNSENSPITGQFLGPIFIDSEKNVWVSQAKPGGLFKYDGTSWHSYSSDDIKLSKISVIAMCEGPDNIIYIAGGAGISQYDGEKWSKIQTPKNQSFTFRAISVSDNGHIAAGHNGGLLIMKNGKWVSYTEENSELVNYVRAVHFADSEKLYVGYGGNKTGGFSIKENDEWTHFNKSNSKLSDNMVRDIEVGTDGVMWLATNDGLNKIEGGKISSIFFREGVYRNVISDISTEGERAWIATNFGVIEVK